MAKEIRGKPKTDKPKTVVESKPIKKAKEEVKEEEIKKYLIEGKFIHIKVGNEARPASGQDIAETEEKITEIIESNKINCIVFVTHHAVEINVY